MHSRRAVACTLSAAWRPYKPITPLMKMVGTSTAKPMNCVCVRVRVCVCVFEMYHA